MTTYENNSHFNNRCYNDIFFLYKKIFGTAYPKLMMIEK